MLTRLIERLRDGVAGEAPEALAEREVSQAAAALLVHAARIDGEQTADEDGKLAGLLKSRFNLAPDELAKLLGTADAAERDAVDLYRFTSVLTRHLDQPGRQEIVGMLWGVVVADGKIHEFEENLVWRVAELLGVSTRDRIHLKQRALEEAAGGNNGGDGVG